MLRALRRQLQILGFNVLVFQSAEELLASEFTAGDTCLLLDVWMPGMMGTLPESGRGRTAVADNPDERP